MSLVLVRWDYIPRKKVENIALNIGKSRAYVVPKTASAHGF